LETFTALRDFVYNPYFHKQRQEYLGKLDIDTIDAPIIDIVSSLAELSYCFTLQSCYGHFLYEKQNNPTNTEPLPVSDSISSVEYRLAYIALCIQNNDSGRRLFRELSEIPSIDPDYVQFGCAEWFWDRQLNSYALQVEPKRYMTQDKTPPIDYQEALHVQNIRNEFFGELRKLIQRRLDKS
jgi:hypothetical protein